MFSNIIYLELFVALFFLPGFFITVILGIKKFRFLLSLALSYSLLVLTLLPFEYYALPAARWQWCVLLEWVILAVWAMVKMFTGGNIRRGILAAFGSGWKPLLLYTPRLIVPLILTGAICGYLAYVGPYLEIPSDAWEHLRRFQWQKLNMIEQGCFPSGLSWQSLFVHHAFCSWYFNPCYLIHAWFYHISDLPIMNSLHVLTFANVLTFLLAIYYFGLYLFAGLRLSAFKKMIMAAIVALFAAATLGNMVFAFIRYYAFAPAILNYVLFLAAMALIIAWLRSNRWFGCARFDFAQRRHHGWLGHVLWIVPVLLIVTSMIHTQEALFIFFMTLALSIAETARILLRHMETMKPLPTPAFGHPSKGGELTLIPAREEQGWVGNRWTVREWKTIILTTFLLIVFFAGFAAIRYFKPGAWISNNMIMPHVVIPPEPVNFIFRNLMISPPANPWFRLAVYQLFIFYQVVGCWGLFVYLLFLLMTRHFVKIPYLIAGMVIVPFLTAFNPLTVDMMVKMGQDPTIYRFHYIIPLPFVAGYLFVYFAGQVRDWFRRMSGASAKSVSPIWPRLSWLNLLGSILAVAGLIGLVFPINAAGIYAPYSKIYTLRKIPSGNDYQLCDDVGRIMAKYEKKVILTDDWTAGFLRYYSPENTYSQIKWLNSSNPENEPPEPYTWEKLRNHGLIVINRRNGGLSATGRITGHWSENVLPKVSRSYSLEAQHYLESHPETFRKIWSQNQITVYAVR